MSIKITEYFCKEEINRIAIESGFIKRSRIISGFDFLELLLFSNFDESKLSLEVLAENFTENTGQLISKQAIDLKFNSECVKFFKILLEKAFKEIYFETKINNFLSCFSKVRIKDSTCFQLPEHLYEKYPGSGGASSRASIRIQFEYDIRTGEVIDLSLHAFNNQDHSNANNTIENILENELIIRDLGYVNIEALQAIKNKNAFFINRLMSNALIFRKTSNGEKELKIEVIYKYLKKNNLKRLELNVLITKEKLAVRLLIDLMPEELVNKRIRKAEKEAKKKGRKLSEAHKSRARLNLIITNIDTNILNFDKVIAAYKLRWQIELAFKIWKSIGEIHKLKKVKLERFESCIYAKLIWIIINWSILWKVNQLIMNKKETTLSFYKAFKSVKEKVLKFHIALKTNKLEIEKFINFQIQMADRFHFVEKKKDKLTTYEIINML